MPSSPHATPRDDYERSRENPAQGCCNLLQLLAERAVLADGPADPRRGGGGRAAFHRVAAFRPTGAEGRAGLAAGGGGLAGRDLLRRRRSLVDHAAAGE